MYKGLTKEEVKQRIEKHFVNENVEEQYSYMEILRKHTLTYFNFVNLVLFILVFLTGHLQNGLFFFTVILNACIGIVQEIRAKRILDRMHLLVEDKVKVLRDGKVEEISTKEIVVDDLFYLESGMQIPVDAEIIKGHISVDESLLTGEEEAIEKKEGQEVYSGTFVVTSMAEAKAIRVGKECVASRILEEAKAYKKARSILHSDLEKLIRIISIILVPLGFLSYYVQYALLQMTWKSAILGTVAAVVGMIPEGLVVLTTLALAVATIRLAQKDVLVQDIYAIESLARVNVVCLDKTGTLTEGKMKVEEVVEIQKDPYWQDLLKAYFSKETQFNMTSLALVDYFGKDTTLKVNDFLAFSSERKYAAVACENMGSLYFGAYSFLFPKGNKDIEEKMKEYSQNGYRILVVGRSKKNTVEEKSDDLEAVAFIVVKDILRSNVKEVIQFYKNQKVDLIIISGDDPLTVSSLAKQAGIEKAECYVDLSKTKEKYETLVENYRVFGRVLPEQKKELILALKKKGNQVAMCGDGVNDVPALKAADVSVAMVAGAQAAKDSASMVLLNNDFSEFPLIMEEGRTVINNISRAASMYLIKTIFSMLLAIYTFVGRVAYPFLPIQLTIISAFGVGIPTFFLQMEKSKERVAGNFLKAAFLKALPTAITVLLLSIAMKYIQPHFSLSQERANAVYVCATAILYFYSLLRIYQPLTKLRLFILCLITICFFLVVFFLPSLFSLRLMVEDLFLFGAVCLVALLILICISFCLKKVAHVEDK
ncbi:MAG: HAD-IC family P-type ATPase [Solobacterium sp.]|nr:HAD-IC family P-type ATPase [Solobacterium sp.]